MGGVLFLSGSCLAYGVQHCSLLVVEWSWILSFLGEDCIGGVFWGVCELIMLLGSLSVHGWGCVPVLPVVWHEVSSTGACWPLGGAGS